MDSTWKWVNFVKVEENLGWTLGGACTTPRPGCKSFFVSLLIQTGSFFSIACVNELFHVFLGQHDRYMFYYMKYKCSVIV